MKKRESRPAALLLRLEKSWECSACKAEGGRRGEADSGLQACSSTDACSTAENSSALRLLHHW